MLRHSYICSIVQCNLRDHPLRGTLWFFLSCKCSSTRMLKWASTQTHKNTHTFSMHMADRHTHTNSCGPAICGLSKYGTHSHAIVVSIHSYGIGYMWSHYMHKLEVCVGNPTTNLPSLWEACSFSCSLTLFPLLPHTLSDSTCYTNFIHVLEAFDFEWSRCFGS